jgi:uncharacterized membrane protein YfcA
LAVLIIKSALFLRFTTDRVPPDQIVVEIQALFDYSCVGEVAASPLNGDPIQVLLAQFWSEPMDGSLVDLTIFLTATFAGALVAGLSGFAFGLIAASLWLYILSPLQTASLIIAFGLIVQSYSVWKLRQAIVWRRLWPFLIGAAIGVPIGVSILTWANPAHVRAIIGVLLVLYSLYALSRRATKPITVGGAAADAGVGFLNGILAGFTGLAGILVTIWCGVRGWPKDEQRTTFQPVAVAIFVMSAAWLGGSNLISVDTIWLFLYGLPFLFAGTWLGMKLYGRLNETTFRTVVLVLILISGAALIV